MAGEVSWGASTIFTSGLRQSCLNILVHGGHGHDSFFLVMQMFAFPNCLLTWIRARLQAEHESFWRVKLFILFSLPLLPPGSPFGCMLQPYGHSIWKVSASRHPTPKPFILRNTDLTSFKGGFQGVHKALLLASRWLCTQKLASHRQHGHRSWSISASQNQPPSTAEILLGGL